MKFFKSIRTRLTLWYLVVIVVLLLVFSAVAYFMLDYNLSQNLDNSLQNRSLELKASATGIVPKENELLLSFDSSGNLINEYGPEIDLAGVAPLVRQALSGQDSYLTTVTVDKQAVRLYASTIRLPFNNQIVIVVGQVTTNITGTLATFRYVLLIAIVSVIVLAGIGGLFLASRVLKPVE